MFVSNALWNERDLMLFAFTSEIREKKCDSENDVSVNERALIRLCSFVVTAEMISLNE